MRSTPSAVSLCGLETRALGAKVLHSANEIVMYGTQFFKLAVADPLGRKLCSETLKLSAYLIGLANLPR